jgi:hypothetical protein
MKYDDEIDAALVFEIEQIKLGSPKNSEEGLFGPPVGEAVIF